MNPNDYYRVLVTGGRDWTDAEAVAKALTPYLHNKEWKPLMIIQGGARGADKIAARWAESVGAVTQTYEADWKRHGSYAGPKRNEEMVAAGADECVAFFNGGQGTADCIRRVLKAGIPLTIVTPQQ